MGNLIFNGVSTIDMGVQIQTPPVYEFPNKMYDKIHIAGKNGDIIIDKQTYQNTSREYYLALGFRPGSNFVTNAKMLVEWLSSISGYSRLEDSYEPDYYRMAIFEDPGELPNFYDAATAIKISFKCKPQRFLKSGDIPIYITDLNSYIKIINPTKYIALPKILIKGTNLKIDFLSGNTYTDPIKSSSVSSIYNDIFTLDSELQDCYTDDIYVNNKITLTNDFPKLYPGINWIKINGTSLSKFEIQPRWWIL